MRGHGIDRALRFWRWPLLVVMSIAVVVSTSMPFEAGNAAQRDVQEYSRHDTMSSHGIPDLGITRSIRFAVLVRVALRSQSPKFQRRSAFRPFIRLTLP
jgi:hypothetical protein